MCVSPGVPGYQCPASDYRPFWDFDLIACRSTPASIESMRPIMAAHPLQVQRAQTVGVAAYIDFRIYQGSRNTPSGPCKLSSTDSRRKHFGSSPHLYFFRVNMKSTLGLSLLLAATTSVPVCAVSLTATTFSKCYTVRASTSVKSASTVSSTIIYTRPVTQYTTITPTSTVVPAQGASIE